MNERLKEGKAEADFDAADVLMKGNEALPDPPRG